MNTGAEAVETAIKVARKWGYQVKGVPDGQANIVVAADNFHGRTTTIVSFSTDPDARADFGPYTPGFTVVPYGDLDALRAAIDENTVAVLLEPIQGEAGRARAAGRLPAGRPRALHRAATCCSSPTRSSPASAAPATTFACDHEGVVPDMYVLGKALGGGIVPVSAVAANARRARRAPARASTARPSAATRWPARSASRWSSCWRTGEFQQRARPSSASGCTPACAALIGQGVIAVRGRGLWAGVDIDPALMTGRQACERLAGARACSPRTPTARPSGSPRRW